MELKGNNGSIIIFPDNRYSVRTNKSSKCTERIQFAGRIEFEHDYKFRLRPSITTARFTSLRQENEFNKFFSHQNIDLDKYAIDFSISDHMYAEYQFVEISLIPSNDFNGKAELRKKSNLYDDTCGVEWLWRFLFYNPPRNRYDWRN